MIVGFNTTIWLLQGAKENRTFVKPTDLCYCQNELDDSNVTAAPSGAFGFGRHSYR